MIAKTNVKINLGLHVLRKRPDGYHDLETLFVPYSGFGDTLEIITGEDWSRTSARLFARYETGSGSMQPVSPDTLRPNSSGSDKKEEAGAILSTEDRRLVQGISGDGKLTITLAREEGVDWDPLEDLSAKAYRLLDQDFHLPPVKIFLEKTAPVGAGLGGGSADAAFAFKMLNELFELGLPDGPAPENKTQGTEVSERQAAVRPKDGSKTDRPICQSLSEYAARLGSDIAFFLFNRPMFGSGRGEILREAGGCVARAAGQDCLEIPAESGERYGIKVVVPEGISVSTEEAYRGIIPREAHRTDTGPALDEILRQPTGRWPDLLKNDFETTVFAAHPELASLKRSLYDSGAAYAAMSGSGSAFFALYKT